MNNNLKITEADIKAAGLTISDKAISQDDSIKAAGTILSKENPYSNGKIEGTRENC